MEIVLALAIGSLATAGVYLVLRPRTFQVIVGFTLLTYAINLFIVTAGRMLFGAPPLVDESAVVDVSRYADPVPQALVLTSIVISFSMTALFLVVLLAARGLTGTDHVDGEEGGQ